MIRCVSLALISILFLSACSNLDDAKSLMKQGNYIEAIPKLTDAKIDDPSNKDIDKLMQIAQEGANSQRIKNGLPDYLNQVEPLISQMQSIADSLDPNNLTLESVNNAKNQFEPIKSKLDSIELEGNFDSNNNPNIKLNDSAVDLSLALRHAEIQVNGGIPISKVSTDLEIFHEYISDFNKLITKLKSKN